MKTINDYEDTYRRCWSIYEAMRRFGFESKQINIIYNDDGKLGLKLTTRDKEFIVSDNHKDIDKIWNEICDLILDKNIPDESFNKTWDYFMPPEEFVSLAMALMQKGITIPKFFN